MPRILELNCWVLDDDPDHVFTVKITSTENVSALKEEIKNKKSNTFNGVDADSLKLWKVSIPFNNLKANLNLGESLLPVKRLSGLFVDELEDEEVHVVVGSQTSLSERQYMFELNCWVLGDDPDHVFTVKITSTENVSALKEEIKNKKSNTFNGVDADSLKLWKFSIPYEGLPGAIQFEDETPLLPLQRLSQVFSDRLEEKHIHIVVKTRAPRSGQPPEEDGVTEGRKQYNRNVPRKAPSVQGVPKEFATLQTNLEKLVFYCRPFTAKPPIPVTLLHPAFGEFIDDCNCEQTRADNLFTWRLSQEMSKWYGDENGRRNTLHSVLKDDYDVCLTRTKIYGTGFETDGDMSVDGHRYVIFEVKNEMSTGGAEPVAQAISYYLESTRDDTERTEYSGFNFPCLLVVVVGAQISFYGAVNTIRPIISVLSSGLPLSWDPTNTAMRETIARHLRAMKKAILSLRRHYEEFLFPAVPNIDNRDVRFPYPGHFKSLVDSEKCYFKYTKQMDDKLLFFGYLVPGDSTVLHAGDPKDEICIKFVRCYSTQVHQTCASAKCAPRLRGFEELPGGWFMVVMDAVGREFIELDQLDQSARTQDLRNKMEDQLTSLHQSGFVHGDVRDTNVMIKRDGKGFMLVDFDWAGKIGQAKYPMNVVRGPQLWRPDGAEDGQLILPDHDLAMLNDMFKC